MYILEDATGSRAAAEAIVAEVVHVRVWSGSPVWN